MNDAATYRLMPDIGPGKELDIPDGTYILGDGIYPHEHPIMTRYRRNHAGPPGRRERRLFNLAFSRQRVKVEHVIHIYKTFRAVSSQDTYRHERWRFPIIAELCAFLAERHVRLFAHVRE